MYTLISECKTTKYDPQSTFFIPIYSPFIFAWVIAPSAVTSYIAFGPNSGCQFFFSKIWLSQSLAVMVSYHHVEYQKKSNDPILRKLSDGWTDRQADGQG